jgi:hypothetical protein
MNHENRENHKNNVSNANVVNKKRDVPKVLKKQIEIGQVFEVLDAALEHMKFADSNVPTAKDIEKYDLVDLISIVRQISKIADKLDGTYKEMLKAKRGKDEFEIKTDMNTLIITLESRSTVSWKGLVEVINTLVDDEDKVAEIVAECTTTTEYEKISFKRS